MEKQELIRQFVSGAREGRAGTLSIVGDILYLNGWWQAAFRLEHDAYIVRAEEPPEPDDVVDRVVTVLGEIGLREIPGDHPTVQAVTYAELSLVGVQWALWAPDRARGEQALGGRAAPESAPLDIGMPGILGGRSEAPKSSAAMMGDLSEEFAASLVGGMPTSVILTVGLDDDAVAGVQAAAPDCRVESASFGEAVETCGMIVPHLVIVDAVEEAGRQFLLEFRAEACGRHVPVVALTAAGLPQGADSTLDPATPASEWESQLVRMLP